MAPHHDVLDCCHLLEQAYVLKGPSESMQYDAVRIEADGAVTVELELPAMSAKSMMGTQGLPMAPSTANGSTVRLIATRA